MPIASSPKAMSIVSSRPMWSDTQPKNGRVRPFSTRSMERAKVSAGSVRPMRLTGMSAILKSLAIGASCAVAIRPPAPTRTNMTYITQNTGERSISTGRKSRRACCSLSLTTDTAAVMRRVSANSKLMINTTMPCPRPK